MGSARRGLHVRSSWQDTPDLTLDRITSDGVELAEYLEQRLPGASIIVLGHSFGSIVATQMVERAPEQFVPT